MYDCMDTPPNCTEGKTCGWSYAAVYYIVFVLVITHVMLNLFILVIIQQFDTYYVADDNPISTFSKNYDQTQCSRLQHRTTRMFFPLYN
jgi:hypothetical protein